VSANTRHIHAVVYASLDGVVALIQKFPQDRADIAVILLGGAIAIADTMGVDVEGFLTELRRTTTKPDVLVPPTEAAS
jgi:ABC-type transporter Mla maintaining outer membrane lipid asymmetry permease subunit MlaE